MPKIQTLNFIKITIKTQNRGILVEKAKTRTDSQPTDKLWEDCPPITRRLTPTCVDLEQEHKWRPTGCGTLTVKMASIFCPFLYHPAIWICSSSHEDGESLSPWLVCWSHELFLPAEWVEIVQRQFWDHTSRDLACIFLFLLTQPPPQASLMEQSWVMSVESILSLGSPQPTS